MNRAFRNTLTVRRVARFYDCKRMQAGRDTVAGWLLFLTYIHAKEHAL